jgi:hypothetical protein
LTVSKRVLPLEIRGEGFTFEKAKTPSDKKGINIKTNRKFLRKEIKIIVNHTKSL